MTSTPTVHHQSTVCGSQPISFQAIAVSCEDKRRDRGVGIRIGVGGIGVRIRGGIEVREGVRGGIGVWG